MKVCVVTGGAGFIGSNLARGLIESGVRVRIVDNLSTGRLANITGLLTRYPGQMEFHEGSILDLEYITRLFDGAGTVFHQAAVPSVARSIEDPLTSHQHNLTGTLNVLEAARRTGVQRVIFAASSSAYGDTPTLPKHEAMPTSSLSPYALTKLAGEEYCRLYTELYQLETISLRYFNVFGPRQDPLSHYAAVIPSFITRMLRQEPPVIYGDGLQSRDFTYVENVVQANLLAAAAPARATGKVFNIACGERYSLLRLVEALNGFMGSALRPFHEPARPGEVKHSLADISLARDFLGYQPTVTTAEGLARTVEWYRSNPQI